MKQNKNNRFHTDVCVLWGGSWASYGTNDYRSYCRDWDCPDVKYNDQGFRCVSPENSKASKRFVRIMEAPNGS